MPKFRKKPVVIEAVQWTGNNFKEICEFVKSESPHGELTTRFRKLLIETLEGTMTASVGDWIICGVQNEFYPCKNGIFEQTYEAVEE